MVDDLSFGQLIKEHRKALDLTQGELARRVGCATITLRKIEYDALRPSVQIGERLAMALNIPLESRADFVRHARTSALATPEPPPTPTQPPLPEEIGTEDLSGRGVRGYDLGERIGSGGFGAVYRAIQPGVEREVAIKIILPQYANHPDFIRRFEAEAQLVARLEHPHIVPLYDYWREPNAAYLIMRLLRGGSLNDLLKNGPLALPLIFQFLEQIGAALHAAHRFGVIHRDLKPANILLDEDQNAYLADFGVAKNLGSPDLQNFTKADAIVGSPAYISPEQIRSEPIRPQADIYCLGVVLYEMLTGQLPFKGPTPIDQIMRHLNDPLPSLDLIDPQLPSALNPILQRATAKNPSARYPDVLSLLADLRPVLSAQPAILSDQGLALDAEQWELAPEDNPYKGLRPFNEADAEDFFGRETLIQELLGKLSEEGDLSRFLAVVGPSGSGKSSVVKAGLIPAIRRGALPGSENWFVVDFLPGAHPLEELEAALLRIAVNPPASLLSQLREDERGLVRALKRILPADESVELVLVIDQFEEVFTLLTDPAARTHFLDSLVAVILEPRSRVRVILTLRADFTDRPLQYVDFGELLRQRTEFVLPLTPDEIELAITAPAQNSGLLFEPGLIARIVRDLGDQPGTLPLLQYALTEMFERRAGRKLTLAAYHEIGGVLGALGRRAEEIYTGLDEPAQAAARQLFLRLVTLSEGVEDTRRRVLRMELESITNLQSFNTAQGKSPISNPRSPIPDLQSFNFAQDKSQITNYQLPVTNLLTTFGLARLLTFDTDPVTRGPTVEVAHEALLREWPRLRTWLTDSRADVRLQRLLGQAAAEWGSAGRDAGLLLYGTRLTQLETWARDTTLALTTDERTFLEASLAARQEHEAAEAARQAHERELEQRSRRSLRALVGVFAGAALIALLLSLFAFTQQNRAQEQALLATSRELAAAAVNNLSTDPELAVLLALQAVDTAYTAEAEDALHRTLPALQPYLTLSGHTSTLMDIAYSPDGLRVATTSRDGTARVWDAATGEELLTLGEAHTEQATHGDHGEAEPAEEGEATQLYSLAYSPDGTRLAVGGRDGVVNLWDAATGVLLFTLIEIGETQTNTLTGITAVDFSPDGNRLAAASADGTVRVWNLATQQVSMTLINPLGGFEDYVTLSNDVAFSPDGARLATVGPDNTAILWDAETGEELLRLTGHAGAVIELAFSPDGRLLATASLDRTVKAWDLAGLLAGTSQQALFTLAIQTFLRDVTFSPDGRFLATAGEEGAVRIWDAAVGLALFTLPGHKGTVEAVAFSPDGTRIATASGDATARLWEAAPGGEVLAVVGRLGGLFSVVLSPDGTRIATAGAGDVARVWDAVSGRELLTLVGHTKPGMEGLAFNRDGTLIATGTPMARRKFGMPTRARFCRL